MATEETHTEDYTLDLHGSMDPALLPDITTSDVHMHRADGSVGYDDIRHDKTLTPGVTSHSPRVASCPTGTPSMAPKGRLRAHLRVRSRASSMVEKANSGRMSPIRKRSVKDVEQQIEGLEKENFDLKLRIYFLEQQKGINKDDTLKVNIDLRVQLQSIHQEFQKKQETWEQMMSGYENHIEELENQINKDRSDGMEQEAEELRAKLHDQQQSLAEMEAMLNDKAFESERQLQEANSEMEKLKQQLSDRERQLITSPTQEELLSVKHALDDKQNELNDKSLLLNTVNQQVNDLENQLKQLVTKLNQTTQEVSNKEAELKDKGEELNHKHSELTAVREELNQKDFSLRKSQIDIQRLETELTGQQAMLEKYKADVSTQYNQQSQESQSIMSQLQAAKDELNDKDGVLLSRDTELSSQRETIRQKDRQIDGLNETVNEHRRVVKSLQSSLTQIQDNIQDKDRQLDEAQRNNQICETKYRNDLSNLEQQLSHLQDQIRDRDNQLSQLQDQIGDRDNQLSHLQDQLKDGVSHIQDRDNQICSLREALSERSRENHSEIISSLQAEKAENSRLVSRISQLEAELEEQRKRAESAAVEGNPQSTSTPRDIEYLKKENAALREGRPPMDSLYDDLDIDCLSDTSDTRDLLHAQLAKNNARASAIQSKLLEMSREEVDGGSESSSLLREQVSALMRMRESDKRVMDALKKHISLNHGGDFDPEVISNLAADVYRLSEKIKEMHKRGQRSSRSGGSRSARSARSGGAASSSVSTTSSVYREELDHLRKELDTTRHEASKAKAELDKLSDESAVVTKLQATESLVRQQAEEKKKLTDKLAYYKSLLEAAGLLPATPPEKTTSVENLSYNDPAASDQSHAKRTSRIPRRSSSTPRLNASSRERSLGGRVSDDRKKTDEGAELQEHLQGVMYRQTHMTPDKIHNTMQKFGDQPQTQGHSKIPTISQSAGSTQTSPSKSANQLSESDDSLRALVDQYREEVQQFGRPIELKQKLELLAIDLNDTQDKLNRSLEYSQQLEHSYDEKLEEKDEYIDELEDKIRQLESQLSSLSVPNYAPNSAHSPAAEDGDMSVESVTLSGEPGSRPPSSLHSVPAERASSRVVSLNGAANTLDRSHLSSSGVAADRSTLSFSGSAPPPDNSAHTNSAHLHTDNKNYNNGVTSESGIARSSRPGSSGSTSTTLTQLEDAGTRASHSPDEEISPIQAAAPDLLPGGGVAPPALPAAVERVVKSQASSISGDSRSITSLIDPLDGTTERLRRDEGSYRYAEPHSLGGTLGDPLPSQDDLLNISSEAIHKLPLDKHVRRLFSTQETQATSPEKGRTHSSPSSQGHSAHSPANTPHRAGHSDRHVSSTTAAVSDRRLHSPVKMSANEQAIERYEKQTSPTRGLLESRSQARSWENAANEAFPRQSNSPPRSDLHNQANLPTAYQGVMGGGVMSEPRPLSAASTQTEDTEELIHLSGRLVQSLNKEDNLVDKHRRLGELHQQYESALRASQQQNDDLKSRLSEAESRVLEAESRLSEAESEIDNQMQKRMETAETASNLQKQLSQKSGVIEQLSQRYEQELRSSEGRVQQLSRQLHQSEAEIQSAEEKLSKCESELRDTRSELNSANDKMTTSSVHFKQTAQQLRDMKTEVQTNKEKMAAAERLAEESQSKLLKAERELRATNTELRINKEELVNKTDSQVAMTKRLRQLETERDEISHQLTSLQASTPSDIRHAANRERARPSAVKRLQEEITSILDTSDVIRSNIASALEQSQLNDTRHAEAGHASVTPASAVTDYNNLLELLRLNLARVDELNARISSLLEIEEKYLLESTTESGRGVTHPPVSQISRLSNTINRSTNTPKEWTTSDPRQQHSQSLPVYSEPRQARHRTPGATGDRVHVDAERHVPSHAWIHDSPHTAHQSNRSHNNAEDLSANFSAPHLSMSNHSAPPYTASNQSSPNVTLTNHSAPNLYTMDRPSRPNDRLNSSAPEHVTIDGVRYQQVPSTQLSSGDISYPQTPAAQVSYYQGHPQRDQSQTDHPHTYQSHTDHPHSGHLGRSSLDNMDRSQCTVRADHVDLPPAHNAITTTARSGVVTIPPQHSSTPVQEPTQRRGPNRPPVPMYEMSSAPQAISNVYESVDRTTDMYTQGGDTRLPSTRGPLYAISDLINYELLKKQNEESLVLLSGLEARIQSRLDRFTTSSPLDNVEWCTLKELKSCAENLRLTLFSEKKYITKFYIRELPEQAKGQKYEDMLRAYKRLESRYDWAKTQLMELMRATRFDEDLVAQMKRVKSILKASKENIKSRAFSADRLRSGQTRPAYSD